MKNIFKVVIFDLDDTLYDTSNRIDDVTPNYVEMELLPGVRETLETIRAKKILLTLGEEDSQNKKIDTLDIRNLFDEIIIVGAKHDKIAAIEDVSLRHIAEAYPNHSEVLVVGDRLDSEIHYGNLLGFTTIKVPGFKYRGQKPQSEIEIPTHEIGQFSEILDYI